MFDENRHFLHKNHKYQITKKHLFNGKEETTSKPQRMTPRLWKLAYNKINHRGNVIPSDGFCFKFIFRYCVLFIDACEGRQGINDQLPKGLKIYPMQFTRLPYYEKLPIVHFFDPMHIGKNVTETLWKILDGRRDKDQIVKTCSDIEESNHAMKNGIRSNNNGDQIDTSALSWLLSE